MMRKSVNWNMALVAILSIILLISVGNILTDASNHTAWEVKLNVTSDAGGSDSAKFGAAGNATDEFNPYWDKPQPPKVMPPYVYAYFLYPGNDPSYKELSWSCIKLTNSMTWPLKIELDTNDGPADVTIEWNMTDIDKWPSDSNITLETPDGKIDMRANSNYTYKNLSTGTYDFEITCFIEKLPDDEEENGGIPGFEIGILAISLLFSITYLLIKKKR